MTQGQQGVEIGAVPNGLKGTAMNQGDPWADSLFFAPGLAEDSAHMKAFPVGSRVAGVVKALRRTKNDVEKDRKNYACLEDLKGNKFRIQTPGQLKYSLEQAGIGATVIITYEGKKYVESHKKELHQFNVELVKAGAAVN